MLQKTTNKNVDLPTNKHVVLLLLLLFLKPKIIPQEKLQGKMEWSKNAFSLDTQVRSFVVSRRPILAVSHSYLPVSHVGSFITVAETRVSQFCFKTLHGSGWIACPTCFFDSAFLGMVKPTIDSVFLGMHAWIKKRPFCWSEGHVPVSWRWGIPWCHLQMWCGHEPTWGDHREKWGPDMGTSMDKQN